MNVTVLFYLLTAMKKSSSIYTLAEKPCCLMDDEELRNKMAKHAIAGSKKYSQQKFKDSYAKLYSQI